MVALQYPKKKKNSSRRRRPHRLRSTVTIGAQARGHAWWPWPARGGARRRLRVLLGSAPGKLERKACKEALSATLDRRLQRCADRATASYECRDDAGDSEFTACVCAGSFPKTIDALVTSSGRRIPMTSKRRFISSSLRRACQAATDRGHRGLFRPILSVVLRPADSSAPCAGGKPSCSSRP